MQDNEKQNKIPIDWDTVELNDPVDLQLSLDWQSSQGQHTESRIFYGLDFNQLINHDGQVQSIHKTVPERDSDLIKKSPKAGSNNFFTAATSPPLSVVSIRKPLSRE